MSDSEMNFPTANEDTCLDTGGTFKPTKSSPEETTDSLETAGRKTQLTDSLETAGKKKPTTDSLETAGSKTPPTATEQQTEDNAGAQIPEEMTTMSFPNSRCDKQEVAKRTDGPRSGRAWPSQVRDVTENGK
ncbi:hypothetical protein NDU88_001662 [Pleurodeles waltl]|uniref:Uncharacterized protein n=1 Tax=Pleurodeles waltl TaxID=8319 RepID=A0AAV7MKE6_PLEWA|nr:hypothetical protein NDU88_001662 [Pleurodeles waltl]